MCRPVLKAPHYGHFTVFIPSVWWERPGVTHHPKRLVDLQKTAYLALCLQPPPETDVSVWPQWVEPASDWGVWHFPGGRCQCLY